MGNLSEHEFERFLARNSAFHQRVAENLAALQPYPAPRFELAFQCALLSVEFGTAAYVLVTGELFAPGYSLTRTQFETLVRGVWLMHAASETRVEKLAQPLTRENAESANDTLMLAKMLAELKASESAPQPIVDQLEEYRDVIWKAVNSYAHGGLHPLSRGLTGYPPQLSYDVLRNSNAIIALASQLAAIASGNPQNMVPVRTLHHEFADCLPILKY